MDINQANATGKKAFSVDEFCAAHGISRAMFYKICSNGKGPRLMAVGARTLISLEAAADWRRQCEGGVGQVA
jgi:predicted DNA-binding transcriptional regulator AlpA